MNIEQEKEIKDQLIENIDIDLNEFMNIYFECGTEEIRDLINSLNDNDILKIKLEIIKVLNDDTEINYIWKEIYKMSLEIIYYNDLDITKEEDQELFNDLFYSNYAIFAVDRDEKNRIEISFNGIYNNEDQGSLNSIRLNLTSPFDF
jgi:hypothetical protein